MLVPLPTILATIVLFTSLQLCQAELKTIQDDDLMKLIISESHVVALFSTKQCAKCDEYETILTNAKGELRRSFEGPIVKVLNSQLLRMYSPTKEPVLVFFRHGIPLLYHGDANDELIVHTLVNNKEPVVKELTDETFEHLTQAASGATTGDWFVMFYTHDCLDCHRLTARWEAVGAQLKSRMNVARVNKAVQGAKTALRFKINDVPSFILLRQGKFYRYQIQKYDVQSFVSFAKDWYKNMKPEIVPAPKTPFDELVEQIVSLLKENTWLWFVSVGTSFLGIILLVIVVKSLKTKEPEKKQKPKPAANKKEKSK